MEFADLRSWCHICSRWSPCYHSAYQQALNAIPASTWAANYTQAFCEAREAAIQFHREQQEEAARKATEATRETAEDTTAAHERREAMKAYQKAYQKAYRARQKAWKAQQATHIKALRETRTKTLHEAGIPRIPAGLMNTIEHAIEVRTHHRAAAARHKAAAAHTRSQLIAYEATVQSSHLARAHFFFNQVLERLYPIDDFSEIEPIPCSQFDYGHQVNEEEFE